MVLTQMQHIQKLINTLVEEMEDGKSFEEAREIAVNKHGRFKYHIKKNMAAILTGQRGILG